MVHVFTTCVIIAILVFIFFVIWNQNSSINPPQIPHFRNCLTKDGTTFIDVQHVPIDEKCPSSTLTCPQYFGCDNDNIPFCQNSNGEGGYDEISCPTCENGQWKCDFFLMGNNKNGIPNLSNQTQHTCSGDNSTDRINCEYNYCESLGDDCKWGSYNTGGTTMYTPKGVPSEHMVSGYKVSSSGDHPIFNLSFGHDASIYLGGVVKTIDGISLQRCIAEAEQPYTYDQNDFDGSFGLVYDAKNFSCDLHQIGDGVSWNYSTSKSVKGR